MQGANAGAHWHTLAAYAGLAVGCVALLPIYFEHRQQQAVLCSKTS